MMKELMRESYASEWKKAYTATKIYSGFFNFTKVMYEPYFDDDNRPETRETKTKMKEIFGRTITEIEQHYLSTGDLELIESPHNRTFGNMIGKGYSVRAAQSEMKMVAEGYIATKKAFQLNNKKDQVKTPILNAVYKILYEKKSSRKIFKQLSDIIN